MKRLWIFHFLHIFRFYSLLHHKSYINIITSFILLFILSHLSFLVMLSMLSRTLIYKTKQNILHGNCVFRDLYTSHIYIF